MNFDSLWVEKYRPTKLSDLVLSDQCRATIERYRGKDIPILLFVGPPGTGKSTLAKIIVKELLNTQYLYINASDENGIDTIRSKVTSFAQTRSISGTVKVIILDESDGLSSDAQRSLRNVMEEYSRYTRFILTANYKTRVIEPLLSRCQLFQPQFEIADIVKRLQYIAQQENVQISNTDITQIARQCFPDIRHAINILQKDTINGVYTPVVSNTNSIITNIYLLTTSGHVLKARQYLIKCQEQFNNDYQKLLYDLFNHVDKQQIDDSKKKVALVCIHEYIYKSNFVMDQEINMYACLLALSDILSNT